MGGGGHRGAFVSDLMNVSQVEAEEFSSCFSNGTLPGEALRPPTKIGPVRLRAPALCSSASRRGKWSVAHLARPAEAELRQCSDPAAPSALASFISARRGFDTRVLSMMKSRPRLHFFTLHQTVGALRPRQMSSK